jgi:hypothetical protein
VKIRRKAERAKAVPIIANLTVDNEKLTYCHALYFDVFHELIMKA